MKANRALRAIAATAATALTAVGLAAVAIAPADAATKSTLVIQQPNAVTSLNSSTNDGNTTYNSVVSYLTGIGFTYYDNNTKLIKNEKFGTMRLAVNKPKDFQIEYTVKPGQTWSDGTPIDAVDLLLSHVVQSDKYSIAAGLGDPAKTTPAFDSVSYSGQYSEHIVGNPVLSSNNMKLTLKFDQPLPSWELLAPGPSPVHALELMADGKKGLQSAAANKAAKAKFLSDFTSKNTARLKKIGDIWTNDYNVTNINDSTNDLLLISNGGYQVKSGIDGQSVTLVQNPKYNSGPALSKTNPVKTIVLKNIASDTAAVAALRNGDVDVYFNTNPTIAGKALLDAVPGINVIAAAAASYSHFDLRVGPANGTKDSYTGPFYGNRQKAKDLRHAFLLALPREQMVDTLLKPISPTVKTMDTQFAFQGTPEYNKIAAANGNKEYSVGTQADRTAKALALVKTYYPNASATAPQVPVKILFANTSALRVSLAKLIQAEAKKAGFDVDITGNAAWSAHLQDTAYDATMYGFSLNSISQSTTTEIYKSTGGNNNWGWAHTTVDSLANDLQGGPLSAAQVTAKRIAIEKIAHDNYWGLPLYQGITITAGIKSLKNLKAAPLSPNFFWNYWEWHF
jgi:peptide/nickel transport system substrate-binding protein